MMIGIANGLLDCNIEVGVEKKVGTITLNGVTYDRYVKIIDCGALPNNDRKLVAHGLSGFQGILSVSGAASSSNNLVHVALPHVNCTALNEQIMLFLNGDNIIIITTKDQSNYNKSLVAIEYYK